MPVKRPGRLLTNLPSLEPHLDGVFYGVGHHYHQRNDAVPGQPGSAAFPPKFVRMALRLYLESIEQLRDAFSWADGRPIEHVEMAQKIARDTRTRPT